MKLNCDRLTTPVWKFWKQNPRNRWMLSILWVLLIGWLAFFWNLGNIGLIDETEPLFAEAARQMTVTGDWITPYFNDATRFDKPPLVYWLMAIAYKTIGVNEWSVRLPSAVSAIALTGLGFYTLLCFGYGPSAKEKGQSWLSAWIGAALIALNPITITWARTGVSDMLLSGCMGSALLCFFVGYARMERGNLEAERHKGLSNSQSSISVGFSPWYLAFYVLIALAILTKGPVGVVLPALIIGAFLFYLGNWREVLREMRPLWGGLIVIAIALPWYVLVILNNGDAYIDSFFGYHNLQRFTSVVNRHSAPWYFYFLVVLIGFAPWSSYLPLAIARLHFWQRKKWQTSPRSTQLGLFVFFWFAGVFCFFTVAVTKLPSYVLPLMPAAAILVTLLWSDLMSRGAGESVNRWEKGDNRERSAPLPRQAKQRSALWLSILFNIVFLLAIAGAIFFSPHFVGYDPAAPKLDRLLQESGLPVRGALIWGVTATAVALLLRQRHQQRWIWGVNLLGFLAFLIFVLSPAYFLVDQQRQLPLRQLAAIAVQQQRPGEELVMIGFEKPSLVFYSQRPMTFFPNAEQAFPYVQQLAATRPNPPSVLILSQSNKLRKRMLKSKQYQELAKIGAYRLLRMSK